MLRQILHKVPDTALVAEILLRRRQRIALAVGARTLVPQADAHAAGQERLLAHTVEQHLEIKHRVLKDGRIRLEGDLHAVRIPGIRFPLTAEGARHVPALKPFRVAHAVHGVLQLQPLGQRVDDRCADAVQTARDLVSAAAEFSARVQDGVNNLRRGDALLGVYSGGDSAPVILHRDAVVGVDGHGDPVAVSRQRLVYGVIHNLVHQVMQSPDGSRADVHTRSFADCLQSLQHLYLILVIHLVRGGVYALRELFFVHVILCHFLLFSFPVYMSRF